MGMLLARHRRNRENEENGVAEKVAPTPVPTNTPEPAPTAKAELEYTEEVINKMNSQQIRKLAAKNGVDHPEEFTAKELKSILCGILVK